MMKRIKVKAKRRICKHCGAEIGTARSIHAFYTGNTKLELIFEYCNKCKQIGNLIKEFVTEQ